MIYLVCAHHSFSILAKNLPLKSPNAMLRWICAIPASEAHFSVSTRNIIWCGRFAGVCMALEGADIARPEDNFLEAKAAAFFWSGKIFLKGLTCLKAAGVNLQSTIAQARLVRKRQLQGITGNFIQNSKWSVVHTGLSRGLIFGLRLAYGHMQLLMKPLLYSM